MIRRALGRVKRFLRSDRGKVTASQISVDQFLSEAKGVIHVGANVGQERDTYSKHNLNVLWVEPNPSVFERLQSNVASFNKQKAVQALVTDTDGKRFEFHISSNRGLSSSILPLKDHKEIWPEVDYDSSIALTSTTLTTLLRENSIEVSNFDCLVMDTQGSEMLVLQGAIQILHHFKYIKTEVANFESYAGCCQLGDVQEFMGNNGFEESLSQIFARKEGIGSYFDVVFKRKVKLEV